MGIFLSSQTVRKGVQTRKRNWKVKEKRNNHKVKSLDMKDQQKRLLLLQAEIIGSIEELDIKEGLPKETH
jgi:hypothetical protein